MTFDIDTLTAPVPTDVPPDLDPAYSNTYVSDTADPEAPYGRTPTGRARKRPVGSRNVTKQSGASNERLARQAAKTLVQLHETAAFPLHMLGLPATAAALTDEERNGAFEEQLFRLSCRMLHCAGLLHGSAVPPPVPPSCWRMPCSACRLRRLRTRRFGKSRLSGVRRSRSLRKYHVGTVVDV
jgi:hypothetical protein